MMRSFCLVLALAPAAALQESPPTPAAGDPPPWEHLIPRSDPLSAAAAWPAAAVEPPGDSGYDYRQPNLRLAFGQARFERRLHPVPPDAMLATENELADGRTWVLCWSPELQGREPELEVALERLTESAPGMRLVVRVEAQEPLLECERVRFALGPGQALAQWILALPEGHVDLLPGGPSPAGLFETGRVVWPTVDEGAPGLGSKLFAGTPEETDAYRAWQAQGEALKSSRTRPTQEQIDAFVAGRWAAFESFTIDIKDAGGVSWLGSEESLLRWARAHRPAEFDADEHDFEAWWIARTAGFAEALEWLTELEDERLKLVQDHRYGEQLRLPQAPTREECEALFGRENRNKQWLMVALRADLTRGYDLAVRGQPLAFARAYADLELHIDWAADHDWRQSDVGRFRIRTPLDLAPRNLIVQLWNHPTYRQHLRSAQAFEALGEEVGYRSETLLTAAPRLAALKPHAAPVVLERIEVWERLIAELRGSGTRK